jgi:hypothetical protein
VTVLVDLNLLSQYSHGGTEEYIDKTKVKIEGSQGKIWIGYLSNISQELNRNGCSTINLRNYKTECVSNLIQKYHASA